ncbi:SDR family NAD(P)-dependent oxidoreductase [Paenibacillus sonchi]|uniref:SDR family NAD(P)-dependent oxidoreductase n=1 Tax=Paenibacillus sonchi TaxID=373687 RepID=UPI00246888B6|nr:SDR family NAD(P)-dependent oxidoreductase [Paenibacillus sonchi]
MALHLGRTVQARLILTGRSQLTEEMERKLAGIRQAGGEATYIQADLTDPAALRAAIEQTHTLYGSINGVFHSAMVLQDMRIENMIEDNLKNVLAPKLVGSVTLGEAFKDVPLDFMVFFSSTNSILGNQGQSNYSAACSFQDAFSAWLGTQTGYPVKVINWSFWGNVGAVASDGYLRLLTEAGLLPIDTAEGMQVISRALALPVPQVLMFKAQAELIQSLEFFHHNIRATVYPVRLPSVIKDISLDSGLRKNGMEQIDFLKSGFKELERFGLLALLLYFRENGLFVAAGERYSQQELLKTLGIVQKYEQLFSALLDIIERGGFIARNRDELVVTSMADEEQFQITDDHLESLKTSLERSYPSLAPYFHLTWQCVAHYSEVLSGRKDYVEIMFPGGSKELVQNIYRGNHIIDYYNGLVADAVCSYIHKRRAAGDGSPVRILEIGAGTGGTSAIVLDRLERMGVPRGLVEYVYSDISASFTAYGDETYGGRYGFVRFQVLDIEREPGGQGFAADSFDLILATNVLHATGSVEKTLRNMKELLKNKGLVVINEITKFQIFSTLTFGLTGGWWNFTDSGRIKGSPLLSTGAWEEYLNRNGYAHVSIYGLADEDGVNDQSVLLAEGNGVVISEGAGNPAAESAAQELRERAPVGKEQPKPAPVQEIILSNPTAAVAASAGAGMTEEGLHRTVCQYIKQLLSRKLKMEQDKIGEQTLFEKLGVDSLIIIELNKELGKDFSKLPSTLFFEHATVEALASYFVREHSARLTEMFGVKAHSDAPARVGSLFAQKKEQPSGMEETSPADVTKKHTEMVSGTTDIAIIGLSGRYPLAETLDEFWDNLKQGRNCVTEVPAERWKWERYYDPDNREQGKGSSKWGGFIRDVDKFDAELFHIPGDHAREMDPQERLFLETTWSLLEDAGYPGQKLADKGDKVGVFVGAMYGAYGQLAASAWEKGAATNAQSAYWIIANRTSHFFNFTGPSIAVDTACSSSLSAIHYACGSLANGDCNVAVAGGINLILHPRQHVRLANLNNLAGSDQNRSFGEGADGFVEGEGIGAVLLKPLSQAVRDNDYIYGVIKGTAVNSGGQSSSFNTPSLSAQTEVVEQAIRRSGVDPESISYVDAHATGTALGDPLEVRALSIAYSRFTSKKSYCSIGSVKSNIGHLEASSGISALTKVLLQMRYGKLAPSIHADRLNPYIAFEDSPFYLQRELTEWNRPAVLVNGEQKTHPLRAGISSFGAGGSNAHVIVEEYRKEAVEAYSTRPVLVVLSAHQESSLLAYAEALQRYIAKRLTPEAEETLSLEQIAYTLQTGRAEMKERLAFVAADLTELTAKLTLIGRGEPVQGLFRGSAGQRSGKKALTDGSLETIASHWVEGGKVIWEALYLDSRKPDRLPLPTYCFDRKSYWLTDGRREGEVPERAAYTATYHYNEPYVRDHLSMDRRTLLGVTYCSLAYEAFRRSAPDAPLLHIRSMLFQEPVEVAEGEQVELTACTVEEDGKLYTESLFQYAGSGQLRLASRGEVLPAAFSESRSISVPSFPEHEVIPGSLLYEAKPGVYGPSLLTVQKVIVSHAARTVWGHLALTDEMRTDQREFAVHPALLDGAVLCRLALLSPGEKDTLIPLMIKQIYIFGPLPDECYCRVQEVRTNAELWEGDIEWADAGGKVLVTMKGFVCKKIRPDKNLPEGLANGRNLSGTMNQNTSTPEELLAGVHMYLTEKIAGLLQEDPSETDTSQHFMSMGIESGDLISLAQEFQSKLNIPVYPTLFFEYPNIEELAVYMTREHGDKLAAMLPTGQQPIQLHPAGAERTEAEEAGEARVTEDTSPDVTDTGSSTPVDQPVAIIGISGYMPQSDSLADFWNKLVHMDCMVTEIPPDRWDWRDHFRESPEDRDKTKVIWGGFMKDVDKFDPGFFGMSPREASLMDPQQRLSLELVWSAIEDAGYNPRELSGSRTGVFIGIAGHDYSDVLAEGKVESRAQALTGNAHNVLTGRISYLLNLHGPSEPIDTACSSSLVAVHRAVESLRSGDCDLAIAGGVNVIASPSLYISFDNVGILSQDGTCRTFDQAAEGTVRGEGAGIILLKPLSQAIRDGDRVYGLIRGSAINHGGRSSSLTAPNPNAQADVVVMAHRKANLDPTTIGYVEAHGTGTKLGDPVEINGLKRAFKQLYKGWNRDAEAAVKHCAVGALKPNIGHLETASGIAGIIKILLAMKHHMLPGLANYSVSNPYIQLDDSPLYLVETTQPWARLKDENGRELPYRAGISAFGFSGVNAHIVLEEFVPEIGAPVPIPEEDANHLIVLSAQNEDRLLAYADSLRAFLIGCMESAESAAIERESGHGHLVDEVKILLADCLNVSSEDLEEDMTLAECGLDPIAMEDFLRKLEVQYGPQGLQQEIVLEHSLIQITAAVRFSGTAAGLENQRTSGRLSLRDVAYTLQTGREAMEARIAFIAEDMEDLLAKLDVYLNGSAAGYTGISSYQGRAANGSEDGMEAECSQLKLPEELERLAALWAQGADFSDWHLLYPSGLPGRVHLPAYPFSRQRYWVEPLAETPEVPRRLPAVVPQPSLTALIDSNESNLIRQCYKKLLRADAFYLQDHIVDGRMILPGVVHLEMARMAGELAHPYQHVTGLANVTLIQPLQLAGEPVEAWTSIHQSASGFDFRISLEDGTVSSQGEIRYGSLPDAPAERLDLQEIARRCRTEMEQGDFYRLFESAGFAYGSTFKPLSRISFYGDEALASIHLPNNLQKDFHSFLLHPVLMDGALQTAGFLANRHALKESPYIPFAIGSLEIYGELPENCLAYASFSSSACEEEVLRLDVSLIDQEGYVRIKIKDYSVRPLIRQGQGQSVLYRPTWEEKRREQEHCPVDGPIVLFHNDSSVCGALSAATGQRVILVKPGDRYMRMGKDMYQINPLHEEEYHLLFQELEGVAPGYSHIVHLWTLEARDKSIYLSEQLDRGLLSLFYVSRAAVANDSDREVRIVHLYFRDDPAGAAVGGFYKSLYLENRHWLGRSVGVDPNAPELLPDILLKELTDGGSEREVRYIGNVRQVKKLEIYDPSNGKNTPLRKNGVYMITGGAGGIGFQIALHLARNYRARLVLNGRTAMNGTIAAKLAELERAGGQAVYVSGDISDKSDVDFVLRQAKAQFGRINGILHCAGIIRDSIAIRKQREDIMDVLEPKISGAVFMDEALQDEPLDLFVLFSSISGEIGNIGQCDYAYANSFLDNFARRREAMRKEHKRYGKTVSINWPLWEDGGIQVDEATRRFMQHTLGLLPLRHEQGIRLFEECLAADEEQLMVLYGNQERMQAVLIGS